MTEIEDNTFDFGATKYATKFIKSKENIVNYFQRTTTNGGPKIGKIEREMKPITTVWLPSPDPDGKNVFGKWNLDIH